MCKSLNLAILFLSIIAISPAINAKPFNSKTDGVKTLSSLEKSAPKITKLTDAEELCVNDAMNDKSGYEVDYFEAVEFCSNDQLTVDDNGEINESIKHGNI